VNVVNGLPDGYVVGYTILALVIFGLISGIFWWCWKSGLTGSTLQILTKLAWLCNQLVCCWERVSPFWIQIRASLARIWIRCHYFCWGSPVQAELTIDPSFPPTNCSLVIEIGQPIAESTHLSGKKKLLLSFLRELFKIEKLF
jgi:hypothetical protein